MFLRNIYVNSFDILAVRMAFNLRVLFAPAKMLLFLIIQLWSVKMLIFIK